MGSSDGTKVSARVDSNEQKVVDAPDNGGDGRELEEEGEEEDQEGHVLEEADSDSGDEERAVLQDPFDKHYVSVTEQELAAVVQGENESKGQTTTSIIGPEIRKTAIFRTGSMAGRPALKSSREMHLKRRVAEGGIRLWPSLTVEERDLATSVFNYVDVLNGCRRLQNATRLRELCCLHALNHVFKTRDRVLKNNAKVSQQGPEGVECRDQGFTRPKVLIIVPTKQACVRFVESIVKFSEPDQQENKARFLETYSREEDDEWQEKPEDFRALFGGNHEEDFRIGLKFTRKTIKYFSGFYNSDIILASPLGLTRTVMTQGNVTKGKDKKKGEDADFLSSIEVVILDHANALQMQNWQHVDHVFSHLNLLPKESHGCDFSRVRNWYLDGHAKYLRQTIILSEYLTPEMNALASHHLHNIVGRVKYIPTYRGAMLDVSTSLPFTVTQTFLRFDSPSPLHDHDARFKYFTSTMLPPLLRDKQHKGVLLFIPTYLDFVRVRNHFATSTETTSLSFGSISEYTEAREVARARSHFLSGRHSVLLYSERAHHHFRYQVKGVRKVIFYGVPENPVFWSEMISLLSLNPDVVAAHGGKPKGLVRALFSRWDVLKLERVVGTERVGRLVSDTGLGDTFDFV